VYQQARSHRDGWSNAQYWYDMTQPFQPGGPTRWTLRWVATRFTTTTDALQLNYALFNCYFNNESTAIR